MGEVFFFDVTDHNLEELPVYDYFSWFSVLANKVSTQATLSNP